MAVGEINDAAPFTEHRRVTERVNRVRLPLTAADACKSRLDVIVIVQEKSMSFHGVHGIPRGAVLGAQRHAHARWRAHGACVR